MSLREPPYTRDILRLASAIPHQVDFAAVHDGAELRSRTCGSRVRVAVEVDAEGRVTAIRQAVEACAYGQAAAALMAGRAIGADRKSAQADLDMATRWLKGAGQAEWLAVLEPALQRPSRHEAILLPFRALLAALKDQQS